MKRKILIAWNEYHEQELEVEDDQDVHELIQTGEDRVTYKAMHVEHMEELCDQER